MQYMLYCSCLGGKGSPGWTSAHLGTSASGENFGATASRKCLLCVCLYVCICELHLEVDNDVFFRCTSTTSTGVLPTSLMAI